MSLHTTERDELAAFARRRGWKRRRALRNPPHYEWLRLENKAGEVIVFYRRETGRRRITPRGETARALAREFQHEQRGWCDERCDQCAAVRFDSSRWRHA